MNCVEVKTQAIGKWVMMSCLPSNWQWKISVLLLFATSLLTHWPNNLSNAYTEITPLSCTIELSFLVPKARSAKRDVKREEMDLILQIAFLPISVNNSRTPQELA